jgi:hypothetical protein
MAGRVSLAVVSMVLALLLIWAWTIVTRPANRLEDWLEAVSGGAEDRGWSYLGSGAHVGGGFVGSREAYLADARSADWSEFRWGEPETVWTDDGFAHVVAPLRSEPSTVPRFILDRRLVHGICENGRPVAIGVYEDRSLFRPGGMGSGGLAGSGVECNALFTGDVLSGNR